MPLDVLGHADGTAMIKRQLVRDISTSGRVNGTDQVLSLGTAA